MSDTLNFGKLVKQACLHSKQARDMRNYEEIRLDLFNVFPLNSGVDIHFFGSRVFGLSHDISDLDIFFELGNNYCSKPSKKRDAKMLMAIKRQLSENWKVVVFIPSATVPLLKLQYLPLNLNCDIVVANGMGVENSLLIKHLFDIQPEARPLYHSVRLWLNVYNLKFRSYLLTLLVIFFLQRHNLMPTIERVQHSCDPNFIGGWNVAFNPRINLKSYGVRKMQRYTDHVLDFFRFYCEYEFNIYVISTYCGRSILRCYYDNDGFKLERPVCVASLFNPSFNCSNDVGVRRLKRFIGICTRIANGAP